MPKWEYCAVWGISSIIRGLRKGSYVTDPDFWAMNRQGIKVAPMKGGIHQVAATIAKLGEEGWEMVGCGNVSEGAHTIYFKRPLEK
jgi:hypothetical protein